VGAYFGPLFRLVFQMVPHHQDAEDILQETFFRFYQALKRVDEGQDPFPFLRTIAVRRTYTFLKRDRRTELPLDELPEGLPQLSVQGHQYEIRTLYRWAQGLPPNQRLVFLMREILGLEDSEIARLADIREVTVRRHASLARQSLERKHSGGGR
jgi:RNA polymerase sigma-70 factor, ECF subfamily